MKRLIITVLASFLTIYLSAQDIRVSFRPYYAATQIDSIWVTNLRTGQKIKLSESETLVLAVTTGITRHDDVHSPVIVYPNPSDGETALSFWVSGEGKIKVEIYNSGGSLLASQHHDLGDGMHTYSLTFPGAGVYYIALRINDELISYKAVQTGSGERESSIIYRGSDNPGLLKHAADEKTISFEPGDILYSSAFSGRNTTIVTNSPTADKIYFVYFYECIDADDRSYKITVIDDKIWMAENLAYLPAVSPPASGSLTDPFYYVYDYSGSSVTEARATAGYQNFGVLYNWSAAEKACPEGWHLPGDPEWKALEMKLGMTPAQADETGGRGSDQGTRMKTTSGWHNNGNGTNASGFSGLPGGNRTINGYFVYSVQRGFWWSATEVQSAFAWYRHLAHDAATVYRTTTTKENGYSVRCVK